MTISKKKKKEKPNKHKNLPTSTHLSSQLEAGGSDVQGPCELCETHLFLERTTQWPACGGEGLLPEFPHAGNQEEETELRGTNTPLQSHP